MRENAIPITPKELEPYCNENAEIGQLGGMVGGQRLTNVWYLMHNPKVEGGYAKRLC